jgi:hypothetical protein
VNYLEDIPETKPRFDFELVAQALTPVVLIPREGATILGIHGDWGAGKTTLMKAIERTIKRDLVRLSGDTVTDAIHVEFNAWKYQDREALWRALILRVVGELRNKAEEKKWQEETKFVTDLEASLYRAFEVQETGPWKVNWRVAITEVLRLALAVVRLDFVADAIRESTGWLGKMLLSKPKKADGDKDKPLDANLKELSGILERTTVKRHVDQVESIEQFLAAYQKLVKLIAKRACRIFVYVDDLDRCLPDEALKVFEAIKLFLDASGCAFMVALDRDVIRKGLAVRYGRPGEYGKGQNLIDPDQYIEKTISLSFDLPRLAPDDMVSLIDDAALRRKMTAEQKTLIAMALGPNPRRIKRFMNALSVQLGLAAAARGEKRVAPEWLFTKKDKDEDDWEFLWFVKLMLLSYRYSGAATILMEDFELLKRLHATAKEYVDNKARNPDVARKTLLAKVAIESPPIAALGDSDDFWVLLSLKPGLTDNADALGEIAGWFRKMGNA